MTIDFKKIQIDEELENLLPILSEDDSDSLTQSLLDNGFDQKFGRIKVWFPENNDGTGYIVDGHNRYKICSKNGIELSDYCFEPVYFDSKEDVIKWMLENQLARRNLSPAEKYEIVERYTVFLNNMAKKNQSDGGKGLSNLTKVNVRQEKAKRAGMSDGNYYKLDKVMKSDNEEVKQKLREKKISVDKAYREIKNPKPVEKESITPEQKIIEFDNRMNEIDREISSLRTEREYLMRRRSSLFESLDIECELKSDDSPVKVYDPETKSIVETDRKKMKRLISKKKLRRMAYKDGVTINGVHYVNYQRTSSKARIGNCLFIREDYFTVMDEWQNLGIPFRKMVKSHDKDNHNPFEEADIVSIRSKKS